VLTAIISATTFEVEKIDLACVLAHSPKAISGKGSAAERMVALGQGSLFEGQQAPIVVPISRAALNKSVWYFCMSFDAEGFCAELSLPASIKGDNFSSFIERIFIADGTESDGARSPVQGSGPVEVDPVVLRK
jgi:hypothetical protein